MAGITVAGMGSGLDINSLVTGLVEAEAAPIRSRLDKGEARLTTELSAVGTLKGALSEFQDSLKKLNSTTKFETIKTTVGNESLLSASALSSAQPASYSIEVKQLAQSQKLASESFSDLTSAIGSGTLTFSFGSYDADGNTFTANAQKSPQTVTIDPSNNTLAGIRDAINQAGIGVQASLINDGTGYRLVTTSTETGAANGLKITVGDSDGNHLDTTGLSRLAFDPTAAVGAGKNLTQTVAAQDAKLVVDGINVTNASNTMAGVVQGVTLNLKSAQVGSPTTLTVGRDTTGVSELVNGFVESYNALIGTIDDLTRFNPATGDKGPLVGDAGARTIVSQLRSIIGAKVTGSDGALKSLADLGITTQRDGTLGLDGAKLTKAVEQDPEGIGLLFARGGRTTDPLVTYGGAGASTKAGTYGVNVSQVAVRGSYQGGVVPTWTVDNGFPVNDPADSFILKVNGVQSDRIFLEKKNYGTGAALAAEMQAKINADAKLSTASASVLVNYDEGTRRFTFTSNTYGKGVEFIAGDDALDDRLDNRFGLGPGVAGSVTTPGQHVAGTIGGVAASGNGQRLTGSGDAAGIRLDVLGGATGSRGSVSISAGVAGRLDDLLESLLGDGGSLTSRTDSINEQIEELGDERLDLSRRLESIEARYRAQFIAMDSLVGQLTSMGNYLKQQMDSLIEAYEPG